MKKFFIFFVSLFMHNIPVYKEAKEYYISSQGFHSLLENSKKSTFNGQDVLWTTDIKKELPVRIGSEGMSSQKPTTLIQEFQRILPEHKESPALSVKVNNNWFTYSYAQYYEQCIKFAKSLIAFKFEEFSSVNIIGFNAPEWCFAYYGSMFARCIPVGIYATNSQQACQYIAGHCQAKMVLAQNRDYVKKYLPLLEAGKIELVVVYNDPQYRPTTNIGKILSYDSFIRAGEKIQLRAVEERMQKIRPGHCCTLVYTSGTTGMPKGVMLSHDNCTWTIGSLKQVRKRVLTKHVVVSYLPLSHAAAMMADLVAPMLDASHVYFAQPTALQGTLFKTIMQVRPTSFFAVPRIFQKIYDKLMEISRSNGWLKSKIANWAKSIGTQGTIQEHRRQQTSLQFKLAKKLVFSKIKAALGLDQCVFFSYGGGPLDPNIRKYFLSINFFLNNGYGMTESSGPQNSTDYTSLDVQSSSDEAYKQVGRNIPGTELIIFKANPKDQEGQICYRGRNTFMGYFKNPQQTAKTIDSQGFLHSGDIGRVNKNGVLFITGRLKQLIITAGGQNIPPLVIEIQLRAALPFISNVMVIGDMRKYLTCFITLKEEPLNSGKLDDLTKGYFAEKDCKINTVQQAIKDPRVRNIIQQGINKANQKAISRAQHVQDFRILPEDFTPQNDLLTPSLKLRRKEVLKRFSKQVQLFYNKPSL